MEYNDFELVSLIRENNEEAREILYNKYKPIIVKKSTDQIYKLGSYGMEINDLIQEGYIGLDNAINCFNEKENTSFYTFALLCIDRQIITYIKKNTNNKAMILNDAINLDDGKEYLFRDNTDIEGSFINKEDAKEFINLICDSLSDIEKKVFSLKLEGYDIGEIANLLNKDTKVIYNTLHRIKYKIKLIMNKDK
ncbi:MAG: sigma-70 family RNA polymerase sigma factor [Bacilli bacterium]|jgi:RNA polymerase sporulation-specific sigma factor|nr:sigma-70 family RNA polymerase sigma factor [Clostridium sp.]MDY3797535.1 sigma-70 family RNA polymerase sigma factor [Bacilli bacterium]